MDKTMRENEATRDYFARREAQERARAEAALDPSVRRVHAELADRYAALCLERAEAA